jgi:hypothetical protein
VVIKISIFQVITSCSSVKVNWRFRGTCSLHLQGRRISQALLATCFTLVSSLAYSSTLKMEVTCSSKTWVDFRQTTRRYMPEDRILQEWYFKICTVHIQWNLYLSFPNNSFSQIRPSISMVPERILFQLWLQHLLSSRIHCFFFIPPTKTINRGFTVATNNMWLLAKNMKGNGNKWLWHMKNTISACLRGTAKIWKKPVKTACEQTEITKQADIV